MISGAARVAPKKAVFRPALPMSFLPGISEMQMATKMTYREQLLHPNWQRKRLEVLDAAGFACEKCGDKETTLNVHHNRYIKGRMAWEYERSELRCLCQPCHEKEHSLRELLDRLLMVKSDSLVVAIGLLAGYLEGCLDLDEADYQAAIEVAEPWVDPGILASLVSHSSPAVFLRAAQASGVMVNPVHENAMDRWAELVEKFGEKYPDTSVFQHDLSDSLQHAASFVPELGRRGRDSVASLIAGFCGHDMACPYVGDPDAYLAGQVASFLDRLNINLLLGMVEALKGRPNLWTVEAALADFILDLQTRPDVPVPVRDPKRDL